MQQKVQELYKWFYWIATLLWYGMIFVLSHQPRLPGPAEYWPRFVFFKIGHMVVYAVLAMLVLGLIRYTWQNWKLRVQMMATELTVVILAALDEFHQIFIPGRGPHVRDVMIDTLSAMVVLYVFKRLQSRPRKVLGMHSLLRQKTHSATK